MKDKSIFDIFSILKQLVGDFVEALPNIIGAIVVFIIGWIISKFVASVVKKFLKNIKVDKIGDSLNEIDIVSKSNIKIVPSSVISKILYYVLLLLFTVAATDILGMPAVSELMSDLIGYVPSFLSALIVFVIGLLVSEFIKNIVLNTCKSLGIPSAKLIANFIFFFLFITVTMSALGQAKINTEFINSNLTMILGGGVLAFAFGYGFASKDLMANFLASFYSKDKLNIGDKVTIDGITGEVVSMDSTSVTLRSVDKKIIVPLSKLTSQNVEIYDRS